MERSEMLMKTGYFLSNLEGRAMITHSGWL